MSVDMSFVDAVMRETYQSALELQTNMVRQFFHDPLMHGPPVPRWVTEGRMFDTKPYYEYVPEEPCPECGRRDDW